MGGGSKLEGRLEGEQSLLGRVAGRLEYPNSILQSITRCISVQSWRCDPETASKRTWKGIGREATRISKDAELVAIYSINLIETG